MNSESRVHSTAHHNDHIRWPHCALCPQYFILLQCDYIWQFSFFVPYLSNWTDRWSKGERGRLIFSYLDRTITFPCRAAVSGQVFRAGRFSPSLVMEAKATFSSHSYLCKCGSCDLHIPSGDVEWWLEDIKLHSQPEWSFWCCWATRAVEGKFTFFLVYPLVWCYFCFLLAVK